MPPNSSSPAGRPRSRLERIARHALGTVASATIVVTLLMGLEAWAAGRVSLLGQSVVPSPRLNHTWLPSGTQVHREWVAANPDFPEPYVHVYNGQGWLESYDVSRQKDGDVFRIFYLGDSFTEGTAPMNQSVPSRVEARLDELGRGRGIDFEVVNTGTSSYSPTLHYILTRYVLMDYDPDLIVVNVDMTDFFDDWKYAETLVVDDEGDPWAAPPRDIYEADFVDTGAGVIQATLRTRTDLFLLRNSYLYNWLRQVVDDPRATEGNGDIVAPQGATVALDRWGWCREEWSEGTRAQVEHTVDLIGRLMRFARSEGVLIMYTSVPHYPQYAGAADGTGAPACSDRAHREIAAVAEAHGVPYLSSFEALAPLVSGTPQSRYYYVGDMHFNPRGYEIWSEAHLAFLLNEENGLLPARMYGG